MLESANDKLKGLCIAVARPLRIEFPGAWYHVMNRVSGRSKLFEDEICYQIFYDVLSELHQKFQVEVHAYCLMSNHYHLMLRTSHSNLGLAMRHFGVQFTREINRVNNIDGPIFRGRYKAILVDADNYLIHLSRYIHLNPCLARLVKDPKDYSWSSYTSFLGTRLKPEWLYCNYTLNQFGSVNAMLKYKAFVLEGLDDKNNFIYQDMVRPSVLGSEKFQEKIARDTLRIDKVENATGCLELKKKLMPTLDAILDNVKYFSHI